MPSKNIVDFANQIKTYMRGAEVVEGKNLLSDDEFSAVIKGFSLNIAGTTKSYDAITKTLEVVTVATVNSGVYISGTNFVNYINASSLTYPCVLSFFVKANKNCVLRGFMSGVSDTNLVADTWTQIYATFNNASALNKEFHIYAYDTTAPTIQFKEMMICSEADWNVSHTYEPNYVPVKDKLTIESISFNAPTQTHYEVSNLTGVYSYGNIKYLSGAVKSIDKEVEPRGDSWTTILTDIPKSMLQVQTVLVSNDTSPTAVKHVMETLIDSTTFKVRGGSVNCWYLFNIFYVSE